ncbi:MAG TPA: HEAT repeat domain-containing protein [Kofleriaceae bacterium]|jgi:serine/threonine-protein kinase|nr:HEAT repeat domain-containing protein [Kofleriaceae bacterium]
MLGTVAPVVPRTTPPTTTQSPTTAPPATAPPAVTPTHSSELPAVTPPPPITSNATPTVGMRPNYDSLPGAMAGAVMTGPGGDPSDPDTFIGQELCGYTIRRKLAEGGMGVVYEGEHKKIGRLGAIKVLKLEFCRAEDVVERFRQEARAVNAIRHENIVDIYDFGRDPYGRVFFVMEYLEGEPLANRLRRGALVWSEAFPILEQTLRALKAAHDKGFVHRDLKPDNIWLKYVDGRVQVKLLDFGIAKLVGSESPKEKLTQTGSVIGTPHYMSPEQINGSKDIDQRTDIYALGVIMYEMFAGVTPFIGDTLQAIMTGHLFKEPPRLADIPNHLGVPGPVAEIVDRMLVKDATARYTSVTDVLSDLYDVNGNRTPTLADTMNRARPTRSTMAPGAVRPNAPARARRGRVFAAAGIAAVLAGAAVVVVSRSSQPTPAPAETKPGPVAIAPPVKVEKPVPPPPPPAIDRDATRKTAQTTLRGSLQEVEPAVRVAGSDALGKIKDHDAVPALADKTEHDADDAVRGHSAEALGMIGADPQKALLAKLEAAAPPPLKVWYASALARLGDPAAHKRLLGYAHSKDLAVSFKAGLTLAEISKPGDKPAIDALKALAAHEAELKDIEQYAGALLMTKAAALHDATARKVLYALLDNSVEGVQLAAAQGLAKLGDSAGKQVLATMVANANSPHRLDAAVAQIPLGEYGGLDVIMKALADKDPEQRRLAARGLGEIGEVGNDKSLRALIALAADKDWMVRIAASTAIVEIVGLDPQVLAQASVDWTKSALTSQDWAVRKAAAGVLSDIPAKDAVPLLAQAFADKSSDVRIAASKSAGKIKTAEAATKVADAVKTETDPKVKEQQVKALGEIGQVGGAEAHDTLAQISAEPGRIGVFAAGSLIAFGDLAGKAKLELAVAAPQTDMRLAAVEAAAAANNPIVVPTLKIGVIDKLFNIRFEAAVGLAGYMDEKATAVPVLKSALASSKDNDVIGRAVAALTRLGEPIEDQTKSPAELVDSPDPRLRLAAVSAVRVMPPAEGVPLLRRLVQDQDQDVRHAGVDAIEGVAAKDKDQAIKLYRPLVNDADPIVRSKAAGQLARLVPPPPPPPAITAAATPPTPPPPPPPVAPAGPPPEVKTAVDEATAAAADIDPQAAAIDALAKDQATTIAAPQQDTSVAHVNELAEKAREQAEALDAAAAKIEADLKRAADAAGSAATADTTKLVADAQPLVMHAKAAAAAAHDKAGKLAKAATDYRTQWTGDVSLYITEAKTEIAMGNFSEAKKKLALAGKGVPKGTRNSQLDDANGQLYFKLGLAAQDPAEKRKLLQLAKTAYQQVAKSGGGLAASANDQLANIAEELKPLDPPAP